MILLDTSVLSRVFRRRQTGPAERRLQAVVEDLMNGEAQLGLPGVVLQEVLSGIRNSSAIAGGHELFAMDEDFRGLARHAPLKLFKVMGVA